MPPDPITVPPTALSALTASGWLTRCPPDFVTAVITHGVARELDRDTPIYRAGERGDALFGVMSGAVAFSLVVADRVHLSADVAGAGSWFGDVGVFAEGTRAASAVARIDTRLMVVDTRAIEAITADRPEWWRHFAPLAALNDGRALRANGHFFHRSPVARVATKILHISAGADGTVPVTQSELATMSGLSRSLISRALHQLEVAGAVSVKYSRIVVRDEDVLRATVAGAAAPD